MSANPIGFSTGSLSPGNALLALSMLSRHGTTAVELSALRINELDEVLKAAVETDLTAFDYISFHAPSKFSDIIETEVLWKLQPIIDRRWPIIVHPDVITDWSAWQKLGSLVIIENMDGRKPAGRTVEELSPIFARLPQARF